MAASPEQPSTDFEDTLRQDQIRDLERLLLGESGQIVSLSGAPGSGKTSLAAYFAETHKGRFPGGAPIFPASLMGIDGGAAILSQLQAEDSTLLVLDEADRVPVNLLGDLIRRIREDYPLASVLMTSSVPLVVGGSGHSVAMPPLSTSQILTLLTQQVDLTSHDAEELAGLLAGNTAAVAAVSHRLASGMPAERILEWLRGGHLPVAVDAAGRELAPSSPEHARLSLVVNEISEELIGELAANPKLLYELDPRKFEKLVAQLYRRQGFDTTLTPSTGDEGVDIYVVSSLKVRGNVSIAATPPRIGSKPGSYVSFTAR